METGRPESTFARRVSENMYEQFGVNLLKGTSGPAHRALPETLRTGSLAKI